MTTVELYRYQEEYNNNRASRSWGVRVTKDGSDKVYQIGFGEIYPFSIVSMSEMSNECDWDMYMSCELGIGENPSWHCIKSWVF
ncbi:hypothetical protein PQC39_gp034 [Vibrio phage Vp_R1]|uniref:Uncharacterized protein n=1 Tax=Vibrio phage Vp_R1 TaxID=2059867 RepID=A0A2H5BPZ3_9CAUD|nr:hypothetical protein PQC39_gp034 [Vibrio phage Vp_R1]AUG88398.1 hypothetical protein VPR_034 [Vibrio phage Vp_R1]